MPKATFIRRTNINDEEANDFTFFFAVPSKFFNFLKKGFDLYSLN